ncbi:MAG: hypothetical protein EHM24_14245 [Acidobacteria bacterium]|nr:MAG: hypothetical protein EHM24_14245 [Acidobacteriota bacterium]
MRGRPILPLLLLLLPLSVGIAGAQPPPPLGRVEIFGGFTFVAPTLDTLLTTSYTPPFRYATAEASSAGQTLQIAGDNGTGLELGAAFFFTEAVGIQVLFGADSFDLGGTNAPYTAHLEYISRQPPDYTPRPVIVDHAEDWPDTVGQLKQRHLSFNAVGRTHLGRRVTGQVSGGLTYFRMEGLVSPVGFSVYQLGGHSVLFPEHYQLEVALDPAHTWGGNVGGGIDVELGRNVALTADFRYFAGGTISSPVAVSQILNEDEVISVDPIETIQETLDPPAVELKPTRVRVMAGIRITF